MIRGMKNVLVVVTVIMILGLAIAPISAEVAWINSANTVIVLPTTKIVNGTPLHIGEDAISGSRLGAFLVLQGITIGKYTSVASVPVEYHSVLIPDENQVYLLNEEDMPDVGINVSDQPVGDVVVVQVNFSRVGFNLTRGSVEFLDRSVEVTFNENTTPLDVGEDYKVVSTTVDGKDTMFLYSHEAADSKLTSLGDSITVGGWKLKPLDININASKMLVELTYPSGIIKTKAMARGRYYIMYLTADGEEDFEEYDSYPVSRLNELFEAGADKVFLFSPTDFFIGVSGSKTVIYSYEYYEKVGRYQDGDIYSDQWVWDIDPEHGLYTLYLHVGGEGFPRVFVAPGQSLSIPTGWNLSIVPFFAKNAQGDIVGVSGYRFVRRVSVAKQVSITAPKVQATEDVYSLIINDTQLTALPSDKNVIIVGGWVSNSAWALLERVYGKDVVDSIKREILRNGYVVKNLPNPNNSRYRVIILAGRTHVETGKAVEEFMASQ
ncbi:S-layer protein [Thermococcus sp. JdF3]|uniref:S-layer protein n=1 Tax=Thermococcus sp. JdF3 TaxID=1638258 RepID=UPI00351AC272